MKSVDATRYWCAGCRRPLYNDPSKPGELDTITARVSGGIADYTHDGCGARVAPSVRSAQA